MRFNLETLRFRTKNALKALPHYPFRSVFPIALSTLGLHIQMSPLWRAFSIKAISVFDRFSVDENASKT